MNPLLTDWITIFKGIEGRVWHQDIKHWSFAATPENKKAVQKTVGTADLRYAAEYQHRVWLFESPTGDHYSERSVQQIFSDALQAAKTDKRLGTHSLRHSYATHLL